MDAHKKAINVAMLLPGTRSPVEWEVPNEPAAVKRLVRKLQREAPGEIRCCYEAGPVGYTLQRQLMSDKKAGVICEVIAPSLIPVKPGVRVKTDRRDARKLADLFRAGLLTEVHPPTEAEESLRDLCRCRKDAKEDLMRTRHRLGKMLLRRALVYGLGKKAWTQAHRQWTKGLAFDHEADQSDSSSKSPGSSVASPFREIAFQEQDHCPENSGVDLRSFHIRLGSSRCSAQIMRL